MMLADYISDMALALLDWDVYEAFTRDDSVDVEQLPTRMSDDWEDITSVMMEAPLPDVMCEHDAYMWDWEGEAY